jgi:hypothetical protein
MLLLLVCCLLGWFVAIPRIRDDIRDQLADNLATNVASQLSAQVPAGQQLEAGEYAISVTDIEREIAQNFNQSQVDSLAISAANGELRLTVESGGQSFNYSGVPVAENGELEMTDMRADNDVASFFLPAGKLGEAIEQGVNQYFATQNLDISDIQVTGDDIVVQAVPSS